MVFLCPYDEEDIKDIAQRAARDEDGEVYYVPDDMTYQEWKKAFVDKNMPNQQIARIKSVKKYINNCQKRISKQLNNQ